MMNTWSMTRFAATVAAALGAEPPAQADAPLGLVLDYLRQNLGGTADRALIYNPDCIGQWFWQKHPDMLAPVQVLAPLTVPLATVMPAVTPVCFGTMYTGAMPSVHGIRTYEKPVIRIDSLFDCLPRAGKRVALVAVEGSSMAKIFAERRVDYHLVPDDEAAVERGLRLIESDTHDVVVVYNQAYDDAIHDTVPESPEALAAACAHADAFVRLVKCAVAHWRGHRALIAWAPDHGCHMDWDGHGNHGEYRDEDINVVHLFGALPRALGQTV